MNFGGYGLALAALALVVFGAYDSYPIWPIKRPGKCPPDVKLLFGEIELILAFMCLAPAAKNLPDSFIPTFQLFRLPFYSFYSIWDIDLTRV